MDSNELDSLIKKIKPITQFMRNREAMLHEQGVATQLERVQLSLRELELTDSEARAFVYMAISVAEAQHRDDPQSALATCFIAGVELGREMESRY